MTKQANLIPGHVLLAIDGSQHSQAAVELVHDLHLPAGCTITILSVVYRPDKQLVAALESVAGQAYSRLENQHLNLVTEILEGHPAEMITRYAEEHACDLVVVGAVGLRATLGILLGGVAQQVVEYANCPVLVVRAPYTGLKKALVVTDGSPCGQKAVGYMARFPLPADAELQALHVLAPVVTVDKIAAAWPVGAGMLIYPTSDDVLLEAEAWAAHEQQLGKEILENAIEILGKTGMKVSSAMLHGDAATEILHYARNTHVDLLVAGSRGLSQVRGWLMGSVSRKLVYHAPCSVLIVKGNAVPGNSC